MSLKHSGDGLSACRHCKSNEIVLGSFATSSSAGAFCADPISRFLVGNSPFTQLAWLLYTSAFRRYAGVMDFYRVKSANRIYTLTELPVTVGIDICSKIMTTFGHIRGFFVPCYHSCTVNEFIKKDKQCHNYHGVEGGAVVNTQTGKLLGLAMWGSVISGQESPVGFSVPNSRNFFHDFTCAKRIRDDNSKHIAKGYYQSLCIS